MKEITSIGDFISQEMLSESLKKPSVRTKPEEKTPVPETASLPSHESREIIQSFIITTARYDFNVYEKRILYRMVRFAQSQIEGISFKESICKLDHSLIGAVQLIFPMSDFKTNKDDKNNRRIKTALIALSRKTITYQNENSWGHISLIANPHIWNDKGKSLVGFIVDGKVWDAILDFSKGYSKFYFDVAFSLESVYSMRLYELLSSQEKTICYSIDELRRIFELGDLSEDKGDVKYRNTNDMIRKVIDPSKRELDEKSPVTFKYTLIRSGRKITSIVFNPVNQPKKIPPKAEFHSKVLKYGSAAALSRNEIQVLKDIGFKTRGIDNNLELLMKAKKVIPDFLLEITLLQGQARSKASPCGWFIEALRGKVKDLSSKKKSYR